MTAEQIHREWLRRVEIGKSLTAWCQACGFEPAMHHQFLIKKLEAVANGEIHRLMILLPPGSAKSTYASVLFPPWFLARRPNLAILTASHADTLAETFGRRARNLVEGHALELGYQLCEHSKAAGRWETSNGGLYFCAGVGAGIAGHRADLGLIDDPVGKLEDADSELIRNKHWDWYNFDFKPRLKPGARVVLIMTPWHEDDLGGRIRTVEGDDWEVVRIPFFAEEGDPLGRSPGEILWREWFKPEMFPKVPRVASALYQCRPTPESGDYFKAEWLRGYKPEELPASLRVYGAGDFAVSEAKGACKTCFLLAGIDEDNVLWILPDAWWANKGPEADVEALFDLVRRHRPITFWAEKCHISKSTGPFLRRRMREEGIFVDIEEITPLKAKDVRAQSIKGRLSMGMVRFPVFASWWPAARAELLSFPAGKNDDFVDALAHLGAGLDKMFSVKVSKPKPVGLPVWRPTFDWLKKSVARKEQREEAMTLGY